ncbi:hypothetical protein [Patulibacter sp. SYSU D01012]|uniref:hypothetical protein n=1 Tax=Patulibacter sp. SYSU D01012 TaxID=2817381 RepID=UPI001B30B1D6|nr:hypothetical protein [Patulibacter sp. SYSU D01012]
MTFRFNLDRLRAPEAPARERDADVVPLPRRRTGASPTDPRRSSLNPDWLLAGDQWVHDPLPAPPSEAPAATPVPDGPILTDADRAWMDSDEARASWEAGAAYQDDLDARRAVASVDALLGERIPGLAELTLDDMPWLTTPTTETPTLAAERAEVDRKWDEADAAAARASAARQNRRTA